MEFLMRQGLGDPYEIVNLQNCILNIAKYLHAFCEENNINYCLMGGSALGAVRHQGFIPWDDDLDVFMRPDEYDKFRRLFYSRGDTSSFYLQEWGACDGMVTYAKLRMNNTALIEKDLAAWDIHHGVYIDIFILHTCPDNSIKRLNQYVWAKYLVTKGAANRRYKKPGILGLLIKLCGIFPKRFLVKFALKQVYRYNNEQSSFYCHFMGRAVLKTGLYKRSYFDRVKPLRFESIELCVPYQVHKYLEDRWGDYMKIPPFEETLKYHHSWKWSDSGTLGYYNINHDYKDELYLLA